METNRRWQDWVNLALGIWLFFSPFILLYAGGPGGAAAWNSYILGIGIVIFAGGALAKPADWEEWVNLALGVWLVVSPWVLGFAGDGAATWNHVIVGILVGGDAIWAMRQQRRAHYG